jgi:Glycosyl transferase family 2
VIGNPGDQRGLKPQHLSPPHWTERNERDAFLRGVFSPPGLPVWPRVTVVTPSFNQADFLDETIQSVLSQHYPNLEYIVIDGGSTDGSIDIIRKHADSLDYWVSEPDRGQCHAINKGWKRSTGDVLAYLNSDDVYLPNAIVDSVRFLLDNRDVGLVYGSAHAIDEQGNRLFELPAPDFDLWRFVDRDFIPQPTVFFRRDVFESIGPLDESLHYWLDYQYWLRSTRVTRFGRLDSVTALMRMHPSSKTVAQVHNYQHELMRVFDSVLEDHPEWCTAQPPVRRPYLHGLIYALGLNAGVSEDVRKGALKALREFKPSPTVSEITSLIAINDAAQAQAWSESKFREDSSIDVCTILPSLVQEGVISETERETIGRRLRSFVSVRLARQDGRLSAWFVFGTLVRVLLQDPGLLAVRTWWSELLKSWNVGTALVEKYRVVREVRQAALRRLLSTTSRLGFRGP